MKIDDLAFDLANYTSSEIENVLKDVQSGISKNELIEECENVLQKLDLSKIDYNLNEAMIITVLIKSLKEIINDCKKPDIKN